MLVSSLSAYESSLIYLEQSFYSYIIPMGQLNPVPDWMTLKLLFTLRTHWQTSQKWLSCWNFWKATLIDVSRDTRLTCLLQGRFQGLLQGIVSTCLISFWSTSRMQRIKENGIRRSWNADDWIWCCNLNNRIVWSHFSLNRMNHCLKYLRSTNCKFFIWQWV